MNENAIFIPNRTFLVRFGGISSEFGRAVVRILARRSRAENTHGETKRPNVMEQSTMRCKEHRVSGGI